MIFATVGTQLPFDRLLVGLDRWAFRNPDVPILAQSGSSTRHFSSIRTISHLTQAEFRARVGEARLIVAHAGMGTILTAADLGKPVILMPRRAKFNEHRNDHQQDTADEMKRLSNVTVVEDGEALCEALDIAVSQGFETLDPTTRRPPELAPLIDVIREFVWTGENTGPALGLPNLKEVA
jgi:UDP-N-acetylglucosamine transferase subunit ALG13